jgi:hypothetical protein
MIGMDGVEGWLPWVDSELSGPLMAGRWFEVAPSWTVESKVVAWPFGWVAVTGAVWPASPWLVGARLPGRVSDTEMAIVSVL